MKFRDILIYCFLVLFCGGSLANLYAGVPKSESVDLEYDYSPSVSRDDNPLPTNPLLDRAKGFLLQGKSEQILL